MLKKPQALVKMLAAFDFGLFWSMGLPNTLALSSTHQKPAAPDA